MNGFGWRGRRHALDNRGMKMPNVCIVSMDLGSEQGKLIFSV